MNNILFGEIVVSLYDLLHISARLVLGESFFDNLAEIRVAKLSNDIGIVLGSEDIMECEDVLERFELL